MAASGFEITRRNVTNLRVEVQGFGNQLTVDLLLWFAREAQKAVDAGMPLDTQVRIDKQRISAQASLTQEIP